MLKIKKQYFVLPKMNNNHTDKTKIVLNWSSGKDAALAYHTLLQSAEYKVSQLLTTVNKNYNRIVMHGIREELLDAQATAMSMPLKKIYLPETPDDKTYKAEMLQTLTQMKQAGIAAAAFGDIFLEDLRTYREQQLSIADMQAVFPLWKQDTKELVSMLEDAGIEAMVVCVNQKFLGKEMLGRKIDRNFMNELPANVDPCGEYGEFHTFVYNAPYFKSAIPVVKGDIVYKEYQQTTNDKDKWDTGFYFLDLHL